MDRVEVILVDKDDREAGVMEKMEAHRKGILHRAFSVFIFNDDNQLMLQQRALHKYHSPGLWSNTCCSHPFPEEPVEEAAHRRLQEEMGFDVEVKKAFTFIYKAELDQGMTEHELDHVLIGNYNDEPSINQEEVAAWNWVDLEELIEDMDSNPENYTVWFRIIFKEFRKKLGY